MHESDENEEGGGGQEASKWPTIRRVSKLSSVDRYYSLSGIYLFLTLTNVYHPFRLKRTAPTAYCDCWEKCKCRALVPGSQVARIQLLKKLVSETDLVTRPNGK